MSQFFKRIFSDKTFRKEPDIRDDDLQRSRRVLVRSQAGVLDDHLHWRTLFSDASLHAEEHLALRDGTSVAGSDMHTAALPILAPSQDQPTPKPSRTRRRLSKRHRRPT
ncbi:Nn.00g085740.m01.CDS01 [Neocucurbitaria sp. VM-36]